MLKPYSHQCPRCLEWVEVHLPMADPPHPCRALLYPEHPQYQPAPPIPVEDRRQVLERVYRDQVNSREAALTLKR